MVKHFFSVSISIIIFLFIYFVVTTYISSNNKEKINANRKNIHSKLNKSLSDLPFLKNNTNNVIEFNSGYTNNGNKIKRNFWNLLKKND
jgi:predicted PurR-regulated permease PerM